MRAHTHAPLAMTAADVLIVPSLSHTHVCARTHTGAEVQPAGVGKCWSLVGAVPACACAVLPNRHMCGQQRRPPVCGCRIGVMGCAQRWPNRRGPGAPWRDGAGKACCRSNCARAAGEAEPHGTRAGATVRRAKRFTRRRHQICRRDNCTSSQTRSHHAAVYALAENRTHLAMRNTAQGGGDTRGHDEAAMTAGAQCMIYVAHRTVWPRDICVVRVL